MPAHRGGSDGTGEPFRHGDVAYASVQVPDADRARGFYAGAVGWQYDEQGRVSGAEPHIGLQSRPGQPTLFCCYGVDDLEQAVARVAAGGGRPGQPTDAPHGRVADCTDDQGTDFALWQIGSARATRPAANGRRPGDLAYLVLEVVDAGLARAFYGSVLGWQCRPGSIEDGWSVERVVPMVGLSGGHERAAAVPMWRVASIEGGVARVRAAGGRATDPARQPYGVTAECTDDQGSRFLLGELQPLVTPASR
jgi:predicted enzyme related to lactoylglutathione lyase